MGIETRLTEEVDPDVKLPIYVKLNGIGLRLTRDVYYRDGGRWEVGFRTVAKVLYSYSEEFPRLNGVPLIAITEEEWRKSNGCYAPKSQK